MLPVASDQGASVESPFCLSKYAPIITNKSKCTLDGRWSKINRFGRF